MHEALDLLRQIFSLSFMVRALVVGVLVALCSSLLGVSLVLKRYSMIGDGLSHVGFGALAAAAAMNAAPLKVAIPVVVITAFLLLRVNENGKLKGDSAIALVSASALALGVLILFPPLTAMRVCKTFRRVVVLSAVLGVACVTAGILLSFLLDVPASACIVLVNLAAYLLFSLAGWAASQSGKRKTMRSRRETNG